jgi:5'-3' exonuclease
MGVKNLRRFIQKQFPNIYTTVHLSAFSGKIIAVDTMLFLHKYKYDPYYRTKWINGFINLILLFKKHDIQPIFVFDTKSPDLKYNRVQERRCKRNDLEEKIKSLTDELELFCQTNLPGVMISYVLNAHYSNNVLLQQFPPGLCMEKSIVENIITNEIQRLQRQVIIITPDDIHTVKELFRLTGTVFFNAEYEAETACAWLVKQNLADAVLSDDTDVLVYGTSVALSSLKGETAQMVRMEVMLTEMGLSLEQFQDFCILSGTDYNENIPRIGSKKAYQLIQKHGSITEIQKQTTLDTSILHHPQVLAIFNTPQSFAEIDLDKKPVDLEKLQTFLKDLSCYNNIIERLVCAYQS